MANLSKAEQEEHFKKCDMKNPQVEVMLSSGVENIITHGTTYTLERFSRIPNKMKENELHRLKINEKNGNHSNILVKNKYIPGGWSIFEPNSINHKTFTIVNDEGKDITENYFTVSPEDTINPAPTKKDAHNPGYCGMFGIIFMVYFRMHKDDPKWFKNWTQFIKSGLVNLKLAANVQKIISTNNISKVEEEIKKLLNEHLILKPSASPSASKGASPSASVMSRASTRASVSNASLSNASPRTSRSGVKRKGLETIVEEEGSVTRSVRRKIGGGKKKVTKRVKRKTRTRRRRASYKRSKL
jgi:hypothetical protein